MRKKRMWFTVLLLVLLVAACGGEPTAAPVPPSPTAPPSPTVPPSSIVPPSPTVPPSPPTATTPPTPTTVPALPLAQEGILLSEVLPGIFGVDNNLEFIELYNAGTEPVDLKGWSLWFRLADNKEEEQVYAWQERAEVPGHGHYLLVRAGKDVGRIGDAEFETKLFEKKGGLALRNPDGETVDALVWGEGPSDYREGDAAPAPEEGASLERLPGGAEGNAQDSNDNADDFRLNPNPDPQNSGDAPTPLPAEALRLRLEIPPSVKPGSEVAYTLTVENATGSTLHNLRVWLPLPAEFTLLSPPEGGEQAEDGLTWTLAQLDAGQEATATFTLQAPWTYRQDLLRGAYAEAEDWPLRAYGPVLPLAVEGGAIPIATARTLRGQTVTVEGVATMFTDGFYAGSTGTKFYLEDESGGIQVYCPGGKGLVHVQPGDRVRVTGLIDVYRDSIEIIPDTYPDDVEVVEAGGEPPEPTPATVKEAVGDDALLGRLLSVEGLVTRIEEFNYSYELDLMDDQGNSLLVYLEKEAGLSAEPLDVGKRYRITGLCEFYSGQRQLKPRYQSDFVEIFPPELMMTAQAPNSVLPGGTVFYTLTVWNHTATPLSDLRIVATPPVEGVTTVRPLDGGVLENNTITWQSPILAGEGMSLTVHYLAMAQNEVGIQIRDGGAVVTAAEWPDPVTTEPLLTFVGSGVPIWAIQGPGDASLYVRQRASTEGVVIGVFPELGGFWIQETESDDDPATSAGLFILTGQEEPSVRVGDLVRVRGKVREVSGQTLLDVQGSGSVEVLSSGHDLPPAVELDPPVDEAAAIAYYEPLEGMLVQVSAAAVAVGPTSKYGETPLVRRTHGITRIFKGDPTGLLIFVDDGSAATHYDRSTLPFALQSGDLLADAVGPLAYTYGHYKIEPLAAPVITATEQPLPSLDPVGPGEFSIATFNVENLFDASPPHPSDPPLPTTRQYKLDLTKTADAIARLGAPTIVGLQEVENLGILEDLVEEEAIAGFDYRPVLIEGNDSRGIDVAYLVRGDQATVEGAVALPAPEGLTSRPPLLIAVTLHLEGSEAKVYVLNNHFSSMAGGEKPTEPRRKAQAAWNVKLVEDILARDPEAHIAVLGDLNSFYDSPPLDVLRAAGLRHVYEFVAPERLYSYIFQGESETLDHILVTPGLYERLVRVEALHIDADYPPPLPDDDSARRVSDHDPIIAVFRLP